MSTSSIGRISATVALLFGLGGCAYFPGFDTEYAAQVQKAGGLPNGNLVSALIKVGDKAAESGDREAAVRLYGRAATINPEHPDAARAIARASELVDQMPPPASSSTTNSAAKTPALATGVPTPVWARPNASAPASSAEVREQPRAEPVKASPVQINVIDLTDKDKPINSMTNNNNSTAVTGANPSPDAAAPKVVTATASKAPAEASSGEHDILITNAGPEPVSNPKSAGKARQSKPIVTPPPLPDTRRAADEMVSVAEARIVEPQNTSAIKDENLQISHFKRTTNVYSDGAVSKSETTEVGAAARSKDADAAAVVAAQIEGSRTDGGNPNSKPSDAGPSDARVRPMGDRTSLVAPEPVLTIDSRTGLQDTKPSGLFSVDASGMKASALAAAEAAENSDAPTATPPSESPGADAPVRAHIASAPEPGILAGETPATHAAAESASYQVQLAAYRSEALATRGWNRIKTASQGALDIVKPVLIRVETQDQGTVYRLRIGGFDERNAARAFCTELKSKAIDCFVAAADQALPALQVAGAAPSAAGGSGT